MNRNEAQRWGSIAVGAAAVFVVAWMTYEAHDPRPLTKGRDAGEAAPASSAVATAVTTSATEDAGGGAGADLDLDAGLLLPSLALGDAAVMPSGAPRQVRIGVVLVAYQGAEGAPSSARSKRDARAIAERLGQEAKTDFHHAVTGGDQGSSDDIGRIPRGVLDPQTEVAVFALSAGEISDVLETPRGYWVVKRIE